jgi:hypothetical protein
MVEAHTIVDNPASRKLEIVRPPRHPALNEESQMRLVDFETVKALSAARGCDVKRVSKVACEMTCAGRTAMCPSADAEGLFWNVLAVFRACHLARVAGEGLERVGPTKPPEGLDVEWHWLREDVIAETLSADGIWPYKAGRRTAALEALLASEARDGRIPTADVNPRIKMAARSVIDAGLADHIVGPKGGIYVAIWWTPAARRTGGLTADIDWAIAKLVT